MIGKVACGGEMVGPVAGKEVCEEDTDEKSKKEKKYYP